MTIVFYGLGGPRDKVFQSVRRRFLSDKQWSVPRGVPKCSLSKYGFRASGVRTRADAGRAETGFLPRFLSSVLKRPSQEVRRELASGERFWAVSAPGQSIGLPRKPQETCHAARRSVGRRARLACELAEEALPDTNGLCSEADGCPRQRYLAGGLV